MSTKDKKLKALYTKHAQAKQKEAPIWMAGPRTQIQNQICRRELELGLIEPDDDDIEGNHEYIRDMLEDLMERLDHFEQKVSRRYAN
ncbi:hypothetical protein KEM56_006614 [Ascosphaera pollenicola]|nr:hypothetical protein KEM56_006614 [Ascosphaera pollenicola]